jgi:hypothetical protein
MVTFITFLLSWVVAVVRLLAAGFVVSKYWSWFILGRFTQVTLNYTSAVGVMLMLTLLAYSCGFRNPPKNDTERKTVRDCATETLGEQVGILFFAYPLALLIGYVWHQFI